MLKQLAADTDIVFLLMAVVGILGVLAKIINQLTLHTLLKAAGNMPKSTHRLIKLVRSKYEHACMIHDSVENIDAFVEKYIYEYRGFLLRIHTWRQMELLSVWFAVILGAFGASVQYLYSGFSESVYQYIAAGAAEAVLLSVIIRLSDEPYKVRAVKMYMTDYLDNICAFRLRKQRQTDREFIDVIAGEASARQTAPNSTVSREMEEMRNEFHEPVVEAADKIRNGTSENKAAGEGKRRNIFQRKPDQSLREEQQSAGSLPINIEGEPREPVTARGVRTEHPDRQGETEERPQLREEAIRQILEEFLA